MLTVRKSGEIRREDGDIRYDFDSEIRVCLKKSSQERRILGQIDKRRVDAWQS